MTSPITEADARTKICPFMRAGSVIPATCFGSECMAWTWVDPVEGEMALARDDNRCLVIQSTPEGSGPPDAELGTIWIEMGSDIVGQDKWELHKILGPRRGRCGACPRVDVTVER